MIRVGVVGAGMIGRRHIATAIASPDAELVGVADTLPPCTRPRMRGDSASSSAGLCADW